MTQLETPIDMDPIVNAPELWKLASGRPSLMFRRMDPQPVRDGRLWIWAGAGWSNDLPVTPIEGHSLYERSPFKPGNRYWVREPWRPLKEQIGTGGFGGTICDIVEYKLNEGDGLYTKVIHRMGEDDPQFSSHWFTKAGGEGPWRSAQEMPRWASRITFQITKLYIQRIQQTTEVAAWYAGFHGDSERLRAKDKGWTTTLDRLRVFWDQLYGAGSWPKNEWAWTFDYKPVCDGEIVS